ncbi:MAG: DUF2975 domain-containing protein [Rhodobacteraceae bacterium]|nr:DUF2975 domain-containing protein [Paracoccaceae bacterium]
MMVSKISRLAGILQVMTVAALVLLPLAAIWAVASGLTDPDSIRPQFPDVEIAMLPPGKALAVGLLGIVGLLPGVLALWWMRALFQGYRRGEILTPASAELIRRIGGALVVLALAGVVMETAQVLVLTIDNPAGERMLSVGFGGNFFGAILAGGLLVVIGWAMREAAHAAEENAGFV